MRVVEPEASPRCPVQPTGGEPGPAPRVSRVGPGAAAAPARGCGGRGCAALTWGRRCRPSWGGRWAPRVRGGGAAAAERLLAGGRIPGSCPRRALGELNLGPRQDGLFWAPRSCSAAAVWGARPFSPVFAACWAPGDSPGLQTGQQDLAREVGAARRCCQCQALRRAHLEPLQDSWERGERRSAPI